jgi:hypothetical protein
MTAILTHAARRGKLLWLAVPAIALALLVFPVHPSHAGVLVTAGFGPFGLACGNSGPLCGAACYGSRWGYGYGYGYFGDNWHRPYGRLGAGRFWRRPYLQRRIWARFHGRAYGPRFGAGRGFQGRQFQGRQFQGRRFQGRQFDGDRRFEGRRDDMRGTPRYQ